MLKVEQMVVKKRLETSWKQTESEYGLQLHIKRTVKKMGQRMDDLEGHPARLIRRGRKKVRILKWK